MDQDNIDSLLERYLALVDEYATLRSRLARLQSGVHQNIARANFSAERGMRYGRDQYDGRARASRVLDIAGGGGTAGSGSGAPRFDVVTRDGGEDPEDDKRSVDPLRWFGILAPPPLRAAQALSVEAVEQVVPRLATVDAEMLGLEIEIRRARKRRAKAAAKGKRHAGAAPPETQPVQEASA